MLVATYDLAIIEDYLAGFAKIKISIKKTTKWRRCHIRRALATVANRKCGPENTPDIYLCRHLITNQVVILYSHLVSTAALWGHVKKIFISFPRDIMRWERDLKSWSSPNAIKKNFTCPLSAAVTEYTYKEKKKYLVTCKQQRRRPGCAFMQSDTRRCYLRFHKKL